MELQELVSKIGDKLIEIGLAESINSRYSHQEGIRFEFKFRNQSGVRAFKQYCEERIARQFPGIIFEYSITADSTLIQIDYGVKKSEKDPFFKGFLHYLDKEIDQFRFKMKDKRWQI